MKSRSACRNSSELFHSPQLLLSLSQGNIHIANAADSRQVAGATGLPRTGEPCGRSWMGGVPCSKQSQRQCRFTLRSSGHGYRFPLERRRVHRPTAGVCCLLEAVSERQQLLLAECEAEEGNTDRKVVSGEPRRHDQIRKTREIGEVRRRSRRACGRAASGHLPVSAA